MSNSENLFRMDFVTERVPEQAGSGSTRVIIKPNPMRYEWRVIDGAKCLVDRFDNLIIPEASFFEMMRALEGMPIYFQPQTLGSAEKYVAERVCIIEREIQSPSPRGGFIDKSEEFLQSLASDRLNFVIMSVDIAGSTKLATSTDPEVYARLISVILTEFSEVVPKFNGHVLKFTGDGILAYFPAPSFITKNDLALDCAYTIRRLVHDAISPCIMKQGLPMIEVRIGIDAGEAFVETIGNPESKRHRDIIGSVVSLAAKIQASGHPGDIRMGETVFRNLHTSWRLECAPVEMPERWEYRTRTGKTYRVYKARDLA